MGAVAWYLYALSATTYQVNDFDRVRFPVATATIGEGRHTVWVEGQYVSARRFPARDYRRELDLRVVHVATGEEATVRPARSQVFNTGEIEGRSLWIVDPDRAGEHRFEVDVEYDLDVDVPAARNLAVSQGQGLRTPIFPGVVWIAGGGLVSAMALGLATTARNRRDLRKFLAEVRP